MKPFGWPSAYASVLSYAHHTSADVEKESTLEDTMGWSANSSGRASRHYAINDIILRALQKADIPSSKEPLGLLRSDGKRPDGSTLVPWSAGKYITWDVTNVHTCAPSYIHRTSVMAGGRLSWPLFGNRQNILTFLPHTHLCPLPLNHWDQSINLVLILYLRLGAVFLPFL